MIKQWMVGVIGLASCAAVGVAGAAEPAHAAQPIQLTSAQMDNVTAGHALINISGNNIQVSPIVQIGVVVGSGSVYQTAYSINYFRYSTAPK